jgi:transcriptional regulator with XRE-family HTH domain
MKVLEVEVKPILGKLLKAKGWTQNDLALRSTVNQASISRFDQQSRHDDRHLFLISKVLGVSVSDLFEVIYSEKELD